MSQLRGKLPQALLDNFHTHQLKSHCKKKQQKDETKPEKKYTENLRMTTKNHNHSLTL